MNQIKKVLLIAVAGLFVLSSCKKDWNCDCNSGVFTVTTESYSGFTKKDATNKCDDLEADFKELNSEVSCEIKKK